jgi:hypothetical protein
MMGKTVVDIVIENIGGGIARDVRFERSENVDEEKWREFLNGPPCGELFCDTALVKGIPALLPGGRRVIGWGTPDATGLRFADGMAVVCVCKGMKPKECFLEVSSHTCHQEMEK